MSEKWLDLNRRRQRLRLPEFDYSDPNHVYFVTVCAPLLDQPCSDPPLANAVVESILFHSDKKEWLVCAYCLRPDHLHLALSPVDGGSSVPRLVQRFKSYTTRLAWQKGHPGVLWQRSYYDHIARREEDVLAICEYILANPVRKGLVEDAGLWRYAGLIDPLA